MRELVHKPPLTSRRRRIPRFKTILNIFFICAIRHQSCLGTSGIEHSSTYTAALAQSWTRHLESVVSPIHSLASDVVLTEFGHAIHVDDNFQTRLQKRQQLHRSLIVGGTTATPGRFPFVASLQSEQVINTMAGEQYSDQPVCGGTLISKDVVLTAAHCGYEEQLTEAGMTSIQIFQGADVGAYDLSQNYGGDGYIVDNMVVEKLIMHPGYTGINSNTPWQHDVMLVKMYGESDQPTVRIHNPYLEDDANADLQVGETLVVVGFGDTDPEPGITYQILSPVLLYANVQYVPNNVCTEAKGYSNMLASTFNSNETYFEYDGKISQDMMCALGNASQDACQGDSGGGLFRLGNSLGEDIQMGIVSWGLQCGDSDFPGVYSRISEHYDWIAQVVCNISDYPPSYFDCPTKEVPFESTSDPTVKITITLQFDDFRSETGWVLESIPDLTNIIYKPVGTYTSDDAVDEYNSVSETVSVYANRFYMLSILDEFGDGFCCASGEGFYRVVNNWDNGGNIIDDTLGVFFMAPNSIRRVFYVANSNSDSVKITDFVTIVIELAINADPSKLTVVALENAEYEALFLYSLLPLLSENSAGTTSATFKVPVFGAEFHSQRYSVIVNDNNEGQSSQTKFEVYLGDADSNNLILAQSADYGGTNVISRSFVLYGQDAESLVISTDVETSPTSNPTEKEQSSKASDSVLNNVANSYSSWSVVVAFMCAIFNYY